MNKQHILFLAAWYPDERDPMFGLFVKKHAETLVKQYKVSVLHVTYYNDKPNGIFTNVINSINVTTVNIRYQLKLLKWIAFLIASHKAFNYICKKEGQPTVNHVHILTRMGLLAVIIKMRFKIPFVITEHWSRYFSFPGTYRNIIRKGLTRYICKRAQKLSTVSQGLAVAMQNHKIGSNRTYSVINNVVDDSIFFPAAEGYPTATPIRFANVSCFENRSKNLTGLVDLVADMVQKGRHFECVMAGTGLDFDLIVDYIKEKGVEDYIVLPGLLNEKQVAELMRSCHYYIQPSHYENVPVVISEALMCGLPVVATRVGSVSELIDDSNGYLVEAGNADELFASVELMVENYNSFDRKQIHSNAYKRFSADAVLKQFNELYSGIIQ